MGLEKKCRTRLIEDRASEKDEFGTHEKVATSVADLVETEVGGKSIALAGSWGSGKSTTVELLIKKLSKETKVFIFDAWSHRGDPLRRTFLEKLINFLGDNGWITNKEFSDDIIRELNRRVHTQITKTTPLLTPFGKVLTFLIFMVPFGLALFEWLGSREFQVVITFIFNSLNYFDVLKVKEYIFLAAIFISLAPAILVFLWTSIKWILFGLLKAVKKTKWKNKKWVNEALEKVKKSPSVFEVFSEKSTSETKSETIETPEPTSVEFQKYFRKIMGHVLNPENKKRLVIVVDNLDRIDTEDALALWSTMKTFFDFPSNDDYEWKKYLWLIVPFDPSALNKLWILKNDDHVRNPNTKNGNFSFSGLAQSFVDKTFNIMFVVPPTLLSDWHDFLMKQLTFAFPDHPHDEFYEVYRVYRQSDAENYQLPTPREIKTFINSLGAIHRQWENTIPLQIQALFVLLTKKGWNPVEYLKKKAESSFKSSIPIEILPVDWLESLSAIYFNVEKIKALQILIGDRVENALVTGKIELVGDLLKIHGLTKVLEIAIESNIKDWTEKQPKAIGLAALVISSMDIPLDDSLNNSWKVLLKNAKAVKAWRNFDSNCSKGLIKLIERKEVDDSFIKATIVAISNSQSIESVDGETPDQKNLNEWLNGIAMVLRKLVSMGLAPEFTVAGSSWKYLQTMLELSTKDEYFDVWHLFKPVCTPEQVTVELVNVLNGGKFNFKYYKLINTLLVTKISWDWKTFIAQMDGRLSINGNVQGPELDGALKTLNKLAFVENNAGDVLKKLILQGNMSHQLYVSKTVNDLDALSSCVFTFLRFSPSANLQRNILNSVAGNQFYFQILSSPNENKGVVKKVAELCLEQSMLKEVFNSAQSEQRSIGFILALINEILSFENFGKYFTFDLIVEQQQFLLERLSAGALEKMLMSGMENQNLMEKIIEKGFDERLINLYIRLYKLRNRKIEFFKFLLEGINRQSSETFKKELSEGGPFTELLIAITGDENGLLLPEPCVQEFLKLNSGILDGQVVNDRIFKKWLSILEKIDVKQKERIIKKIIEFCGRSKNSTKEILKYYAGNYFTDNLLKESREIIINSYYFEILNRLDLEEIKFLSTTLMGIVKSEEKNKIPIKTEHEKSLSDLFESTVVMENEELKKGILKISKILGIEVKYESESKKVDDKSKGNV